MLIVMASVQATLLEICLCMACVGDSVVRCLNYAPQLITVASVQATLLEQQCSTAAAQHDAVPLMPYSRAGTNGRHQYAMDRHTRCMTGTTVNLTARASCPQGYTIE